MKKLALLFALLCVSAVPVRSEEDRAAVIEESVVVYSLQCAYQTYLNIGLIGDGIPKNVYTPEQAQQLLQPIINLIATSRKQNEKLMAVANKDDEKEYVKKLQKILELLDGQASELKDYIGKKDKSHLEQYEQYRQLAWKKIEELLK